MIIQPKLTINAPGDRYEQEADRIAEQVMRIPKVNAPTQNGNETKVSRKPLVSQISSVIQRMPEPVEDEEELLQTKPMPGIQRKCAKCGTEEEEHLQRKPIASQITPVIQRMPEATEDEEEDHIQTKPIPGIQRKCAKCQKEEEEQKQTVQTKSAGTSPRSSSSSLTSRIQSSRGHGQAMDAATNSFMSSRFGTDFSSVRIHSDNSAAQMSQEINAQAFTVGRDIYFNQGKYSPGTEGGKRLLAHELVHVVQQKGIDSPGVIRRKKFRPYKAKVRKRHQIRNNAKFYSATGQEYPKVCKNLSGDLTEKNCIVLKNPNDNSKVTKDGFNILKNSGYTVKEKSRVKVINERRKANKSIKPKSRHWIQIEPIKDDRSVEFHYTLRGFYKKIKDKPFSQRSRRKKSQQARHRQRAKKGSLGKGRIRTLKEVREFIASDKSTSAQKQSWKKVGTIERWAPRAHEGLRGKRFQNAFTLPENSKVEIKAEKLGGLWYKISYDGLVGKKAYYYVLSFWVDSIASPLKAPSKTPKANIVKKRGDRKRGKKKIDSKKPEVKKPNTKQQKCTSFEEFIRTVYGIEPGLWSDLLTCGCFGAGIADLVPIPGVGNNPAVEMIDCACNIITLIQEIYKRGTPNNSNKGCWSISNFTPMDFVAIENLFLLVLIDCTSLAIGPALGASVGAITGGSSGGPAGAVAGAGTGAIIGDFLVDAAAMAAQNYITQGTPLPEAQLAACSRLATKFKNTMDPPVLDDRNRHHPKSEGVPV